jgi:TP901 family phage tail tape measure protein
MEVAQLEVLIGARLDDLTKGLNEANRKLDDFGKNAGKSAKNAESALDKSFKGLVTKANAMGNMMSLAVSAPLVGLGTVAAKTFGEYETAMATMRSVTKATGAEMKRAAALAQELGSDIDIPGASAKDAALAMAELGKAGFTASQSMDAAKGVLQLAAVAQVDAAQAAEMNASALKAFGLEARSASKVSDLLAGAADSALGSTSEMATALSQAATVASQAGISIEDTVASLTMLANAGLRGSDAGTSLKTAILSITAPTDQAKKALRDLGVAIYDSHQRMRPFEDVVRDMKAALDGLSDESRADKLKTIFGTDAIRAATVLFDQGAEGLRKYRERIGEVGIAARTAKERMGEQEKATEALKNAMETAMIKGGEPLSKVIIAVANDATELLDAFSDLSPEMQEMAVKAGILAVALGPGIKGVAGAINAVVATRSAFVAASAARAAAMNAEGAAATTASLGVAKYVASLRVLAGVGAIAALATGTHGNPEADAFRADRYMESDHMRKVRELYQTRGRDEALRYAESQRQWWERGGLAEEQVRDVESYLKRQEQTRRAAGMLAAGQLAGAGLGARGEGTAPRKAGGKSPITDLFGGNEDLKEAFTQTMADFRREMALGGQETARARVEFELAEGKLKGLTGAAREQVLAAADMVDATERTREASAKARAERMKEADELARTIQQTRQAISLNGQAGEAATLRYRIENNLIGESNRALAKQALALMERKGAQDKSREASERSAKTLEDSRRRIMALGAQTDRDRISIEMFGKAFDKLTDAQNRNAVKSSERATAMEKEADAAEKRAQSIRDLTQEILKLRDTDPKDRIAREFFNKPYSELGSDKDRSFVRDEALRRSILDKDKRRTELEKDAAAWAKQALQDLEKAATAPAGPLTRVEEMRRLIDEWNGKGAALKLRNPLVDDASAGKILDLAAKLDSQKLDNALQQSLADYELALWQIDFALEDVDKAQRKTFGAEMRDLFDRFALATGRTSEYALRLRDLTARYGDAARAKQALDLEMKTEAAERWAQTMRNAADSVADSLADMLTRGRVSIGGLKDLLGNLAYTVGRDYLRDWLGGAMKIRSGGGGDVASQAAAFLGSIPFRASGGPVTAGQPYIVGEHQAEVFVPRQSGHILPSVPGGQTFNVSLAINTPDMQTARASKAQIAAEVAEEILGALRRVR